VLTVPADPEPCQTADYRRFPSSATPALRSFAATANFDGKLVTDGFLRQIREKSFPAGEGLRHNGASLKKTTKAVYRVGAMCVKAESALRDRGSGGDGSSAPTGGCAARVDPNSCVWR